MKAEFNQIRFDDADVVNPDDFIPDGEYNPHDVRPFLFHDHGFVIGIVFASSIQDALDELVDNNKIDHLMIDDNDLHDYGEDYVCLGNAGEPFDIDTLGIVELPNPNWSFVAMFAAHQQEVR